MSETTLSIKELLRFPFRHPDWQSRFLIGVGLLLANWVVPFVPWIFVLGYVFHIARLAIEGEDELVLPAWDDWGKLAMDGLRGILVNIVFTLPAVLVVFLGWAVYLGSSFAFPALSFLGEQNPEIAGGVLPWFPLTMLAGMAVMFVFMFVGWLLMFLGLVPLPVAMAHSIARGDLASAFRVREWWPVLRANALGYLVAWVVISGLWGIAYFAVMVLYSSLVFACLVPFLMMPLLYYALLVGAVLFGRAYREGVSLAGEADEK